VVRHPQFFSIIANQGESKKERRRTVTDSIAKEGERKKPVGPNFFQKSMGIHKKEFGEGG
jgi:hypothetical protein